MIKLAIIGTGGMANAHAAEFGKIDFCKLASCCDVIPGKAKEFAQKYSIPSYYDSTEQMLANEELDAVSVVTPDQYHKEPALMALEKGLHVMCEKPLATNLADAREMAACARAKGVMTAVNFSHRNHDSAQKAVEIVHSGSLGRIMHVQCSYLQSWLASKIWGDWRESATWLWRMSKKHGSAGALGDIGVHIYDMATYACGDIKEICCDIKTFKKEAEAIGDYDYEANDSFIAAVRFENGAMGVIQATRWASGYANHVTLDVSGDKGSINWVETRKDGPDLRVCLGDNIDSDTWQSVECPEGKSTYLRFAESIRDNVQGWTSFESAAKVQAYLEYSFISMEKGGFVQVEF